MIQFVLSTLPDEGTATRIVRLLVENHSAACGTIIPGAKSIYRWNEAVEESAEVLVIFKIPASHASTFETELRALHPYETPEIAFFEPSRISEAYAAWALASCKK
jgi:periplasmic divalent cation tolerance protein